ncbi:MAG TPA: LysR family transcriptional regulator [Actinomycetota bacterium]|nr:LysR family transcriptional regulator [Actinomycetota bacterium]
MDLELRHLRAFVAVVDEGSFTKAGAALMLSQASVSRSVAALERAVRAPLLERTTRELSLTATGARILGHARRALEEAAAITRVAAETPSEIRVGYAWAALGRHTITAQRRWAAAYPGSELRFVQSQTPTAGLAEGIAEVAVVRRPLADERLATVLVGVEPRYAAVASADPLARRRNVTLNDFTGRTIAVDPLTGTTTPDLWPADAGPSTTRTVQGIEDWLTLIAAGGAAGLTSEATARQHLRPGVVYRPVRDAQPIPVWVAWWRDSPPRHAQALVQLVCDLYGTRPAA